MHIEGKWLTGLAHSSVVRITPTNGVNTVIFSVNCGKYSWNRTDIKLINYGKEQLLKILENRHAERIWYGKMHYYKNWPPTIVGIRTTWNVLSAKPCILNSSINSQQIKLAQLVPKHNPKPEWDPQLTAASTGTNCPAKTLVSRGVIIIAPIEHLQDFH